MKKTNHIYTLEERRMGKRIAEVERKKYALRQAWLVADIRVTQMRHELRESLRARGHDYDMICETARTSARTRKKMKRVV